MALGTEILTDLKQKITDLKMANVILPKRNLDKKIQNCSRNTQGETWKN